MHSTLDGHWIRPFFQNHVAFHTKWRIWKSNPKRHQVHMLEHASLNLWSWHKWHKSGNISWLLPLYITENKKRNQLLKLEWLRTKGKLGHTILQLDNSTKVVLKVSQSRKQILKFSFEPKMNENIFVFLP